MAQSHRRSSLAVVFFTAAIGVHFFVLTNGTVQLRGCKDGSLTFVELSYNSLGLYCYNLYSPEGVFKWKLQMDNGTTVELGTCGEHRNCTTQFTDTVGLYWYGGSGTSLNFYNAPKEFSGLLHCTLMTNGRESTASCRVNAVRIKSRRNIVDLQQGLSWSWRIFDIAQLRPNTVTCSLTRGTGAIVQLGICDWSYPSCTSLARSFLIRKSTYDIYASISSVTRELGGKLSCSFTYKNQMDTADVILNVHSPPQVTDCNLATSPGKWSAVLSCDVNHAYSSAGIYQFQVREIDPPTSDYISYWYRNDQFSNNSDVETLGIKKLGWLSFRHDLRSYVNTTDNQLYYRGRLRYSWRLSPSHGEFKRATILVCTTADRYECSAPVPYYYRLPTTATTALGSSEKFKWAAIGAAVTLGIVAVVVLVVVAVRRRRSLSSRATTSARPNPDAVHENACFEGDNHM